MNIYDSRKSASYGTIAHLDNGASRSFMNVHLARLMNVGKSECKTVIEVGDGSFRESEFTKSLAIQYLGFRTYAPFLIMELPSDVNLILGRDLLKTFGLIDLPAVPFTAPDEELSVAAAPHSRHRDTDDAIDSSGDDIDPITGLTPAEAFKRRTFLERCERLVADNATISPDSACTHPDAVVHIKHKPGVKHRPIKQYRQPQIIEDYLQEHLDGWNKNKITIPVATPDPEFGSPFLGVAKKDRKGSITGARACLDYSHSVNVGLEDIDTTDLPIPDDLIAELPAGALITPLDLSKAFHQIRVAEEDWHKQCFTFRGKSYFFTRAVMGYTPMSSIFQRLMNTIFAGIDNVKPFIDNLYIWTPPESSWEDHMAVIEKVFARLKEVNLRVNPDKCEFMLKSCRILGRHISPAGISIDPEKRDSIMGLPLPHTFKELSSFIGIIGYNRNFIVHGSAFLKPLHDLMRLDSSSSTRGKKRASSAKVVPWTEESINAFHVIRRVVAAAPTLQRIDWKRKFCLNVDASTYGHGSVLWQPRFLGD